MRRSLARIVAAALALAVPGAALHADVGPGTVVTRENAEAAKDLVSPGVLWLVRNGMSMRIVPYRPTEDPPAFRAATEKYAGQVRLRPDGFLDESTYVAGKPFPEIDPNDPHSAIKIMYNFERSRYATDDLRARFLEAETGEIRSEAGGRSAFRVERHFVIDTLRMLKYVGRTENPPLPALPNPQGFLVKVGQYPILEPFDLKGVGGLVYRYLDDAKAEDTWMYMPGLRRVKRISLGQRSAALYGQDVDIDSYGGFAGQIRNFSWKLLGEKPMLASGHSESLPPTPCADDGGLTFCEGWEEIPRMFIVEGAPKMSSYAYSKRVLFIDAVTSYVAYTDLYDQAGELWKVGVNYGRYDRKPNPRAAFEYPFPRGYHPGFVMADIQLSHGTRGSLPGAGFPKEPGWYINRGDVSEDWFELAALIKAGR